MVEDVVLSVGERAPIFFHGVPGGVIPTPAEVAEFLVSAVKEDGKVGRRVQT
jgi:2-oxoglutarate ferredoxin oxidoreductase subunit alpha